MNGKHVLVAIGVLLVAALGLSALLLRQAGRKDAPMYTPTTKVEIAPTDAEVAGRTETATFAMG
jgi:hypothetical protein